MHIKEADLNTYTLLKGKIKPPLTHVENEQEIETILKIQQSFITADHDLYPREATPDKEKDQPVSTLYKNAIHELTIHALADKNSRMAGIGYLYLQELKPHEPSLYLKPSKKRNIPKRKKPELFKKYKTAIEAIKEEEEKIEQFLREQRTEESFHILVQLAHVKFKANQAMSKKWQPDSYSKLTEHVLGDIKRPSGSDLRNDHG